MQLNYLRFNHRWTKYTEKRKCTLLWNERQNAIHKQNGKKKKSTHLRNANRTIIGNANRAIIRY